MREAPRKGRGGLFATQWEGSGSGWSGDLETGWDYTQSTTWTMINVERRSKAEKFIFYLPAANEASSPGGSAAQARRESDGGGSRTRNMYYLTALSHL